jgi:Fe2+ or Zn2+ uptake regulation protein
LSTALDSARSRKFPDPNIDVIAFAIAYDAGVAASSSTSARLRERGLKVTAPRLGVLEAIEAHGGHLDAATIATAARARIGTVSTQAVYEILNALTDAGLLRRIEPAGSPARYEARVGDNHHHLVCRNCGAVEDVACAVGSAPCLLPPEGGSFAVDEAEVIFWGECERCRR